MRRNTLLWLLAAFVLLAGLALAAWWRATLPVHDEGLVLRSYPAGGQAEELERSLDELLRVGQTPIGTATARPDGQVLVLAPSSVHRGLASAIEARLRSKAGPTEIVTTYWLVTARPTVNGKERPARLGAIGPVLDEIVAADGPQDFSLFERLELRQANGGTAEATSPLGEIKQRASVSEGRVILWLRARFPPENHFETTLNLADGQFVVVGQATKYTRDQPPSATEGATLYMIVQAQASSAS
jgi:hypothetical protein